MTTATEPTETTLDAGEILASEEISPEILFELRRQVHCRIERRSVMERLLEDWKSTARKLSSENKAETRRGTALWALGQVEAAIPILEASRSTKERNFVLGLCYLDTGRSTSARAELKEALAADSSSLPTQVAYGEALLKCEEWDAAESLLEKLKKKNGDLAEVQHLLGLWSEAHGDREAAIAAYDQALVCEPGHPRSLFRLAYLHDLNGDDATAMDYYQQLRKLRPIHVNTMMNLGVIHEDRGEFEAAAECYRSVLDYFPTHSRARLYLKDAEAAMNMYYDEDAVRREVKMNALLSQPITDITFSPRARKALEKLNIQTLGDLCSKTEEDMLTIPNFGKTSLREIKEFLASKSLNLSSGEAPVASIALSGAASGDVLGKPLTELEWSGRVPRLFETLGLKTVGDLTQKSEKDLLSVKSIGATSVAEVRKRLASFGLSLKAD